MSTTLWRLYSATKRTLFSLFMRKRPRMLIPRTRSPELASMPMMVRTHSASTELPGFLELSVLVAIYARMSLISSEASEFFSPNLLSTWSIFTCRKGSLTPPTSYSGA